MNNPNDIIEKITTEIRDEVDNLDPAVERAALERAWRRLEQAAAAAPGTGAVLTCDDIAELLPAYRSGDLQPSRALLIKDHTRACITCRRRLKELERGGRPQTQRAVRAATPSWVKWGLAATLVLGLGLVQLFVVGRFWGGEGAGNMMRVVEGALFAVSDNTATELAPGTEVPYGQEVLAPRGQGAIVELADGSRIELRQRARLAVTQSRRGTTIDLEGGDIIVEAADQRDGELYVATGDCLVSVKGTVFAVSHGTRGSRVSVYEGEVHVDQTGAGEVLNPGDQLTTSANLSATALDEEIAWSVNYDRHLALLQELVGLNEEMRAMVRPDRRYQPTYLHRLPADTVVYAALPNLSDSIYETVQRLRQRVAENPVLAEWIGQRPSFHEVTAVVQELAGLGEYLGDEIVVAAWLDADGDCGAPAVLAEALDPATLRMRLATDLALLGERLGEGTIMLTEDPFAADLPTEGLVIWINDELLAAAPGRDALAQLATALAGEGGLADADFAATIEDRYADGVESLIAVDLASIVRDRQDAEDLQRLERLGLADVRHLVVEQWVEDGQTQRQAVVSFDQARRGVAAWLAEPAPMGTLSFMSPDTASVAAFVVKEPSVLFADILATMTAEERSEAEAEIARFEAEHGINLAEDLFAPLGGEIAIGLDGPLAPTPSWKMVVEVYDPMGLQIGLEQLIAEANVTLAEEGEGEIVLTANDNGGRTFYQVTRVKPEGGTNEAHYTFADGYLVATPSAALLDRALRYRDAEFNLLFSDRLRSLLPPGAEVNVSALWYQDFSAVVEPLTRTVGGMVEGMENLPPEMRAAIAEVGDGFGPSIFYAYGEEDRIRISGTSTHNPLGLVNLLMTQGLSGLDMMSGGPFGE